MSQFGNPSLPLVGSRRSYTNAPIDQKGWAIELIGINQFLLVAKQSQAKSFYASQSFKQFIFGFFITHLCQWQNIFYRDTHRTRLARHHSRENYSI